jgi:hypothetical protein
MPLVPLAMYIIHNTTNLKPKNGTARKWVSDPL